MAIVLALLLLEVFPACPAEGWITSEYGYRRHPITGRRAKHEGIDVANREGTPVRTPWAGYVLRVRRTRGAGLHVVVASGRLRVTMAHLSAVGVSQGDVLPRGALVGLMGHTGRATGDHLHLEIRRAKRTVNPAFAFAACVAR